MHQPFNYGCFGQKKLIVQLALLQMELYFAANPYP